MGIIINPLALQVAAMSLLVDRSARSDGYPFADGPLERSRAPIRRALVRNILFALAPWALTLLAVWYWRG